MFICDRFNNETTNAQQILHGLVAFSAALWISFRRTETQRYDINPQYHCELVCSRTRCIARHDVVAIAKKRSMKTNENSNSVSGNQKSSSAFCIFDLVNRRTVFRFRNNASAIEPEFRLKINGLKIEI